MHYIHYMFYWKWRTCSTCHQHTIASVEDFLVLYPSTINLMYLHTGVQIKQRQKPSLIVTSYTNDLLLSIGRDGQLHTSIYDKRDDFNFHITNFPFLSSNIPSSPAYGVFISQLIRYSRACSSYECFILRARRLSSKLLKQGYLAERLKSSFRKFYGRYGDLIQQYEVSLYRMLNDILILDQQWLPNQSDFPPISWPWYRAWPSPIMSGFHGAFATGVACQQGTLTLPDTWFRPPFWDLLMLQLLRPNSSNLPCLYSTFHLEYPLVLSRFCLTKYWVWFFMFDKILQDLKNAITKSINITVLTWNTLNWSPSM